MSAGMPVLTNEIGIEGIFAEDGKEFFLCKTPEDYEKNIMNIANDAVLRKKIAINAKRFIECNYNYEKDAGMLYRKIYTLAGLK